MPGGLKMGGRLRGSKPLDVAQKTKLWLSKTTDEMIPSLEGALSAVRHASCAVFTKPAGPAEGKLVKSFNQQLLHCGKWASARVVALILSALHR